MPGRLMRLFRSVNALFSWTENVKVNKFTSSKNGGKVVATYCVFVPEELVWAADGIPVGLCAGTQFSIPMAGEVLPHNSCALIESSFGFKLGCVCPYVQAIHLIVGETTCDGKKKMFELLAEYQPVYVMEVPNKKTAPSRTRPNWLEHLALLFWPAMKKANNTTILTNGG
ncbi:2-hydroxyacyl-CoA dehydratase [Chloroflexota bacterium]